MTKPSKHIQVGVEGPDKGFDRFIDAWERAQAGEVQEAEVHLNFEDLAALLSVLTPRRLELLKVLRRQGPLSIRALSKHLERDYKNVHSDVRLLEDVGLVERNKQGALIAPWDAIDATLRLVA
ncbi:HVO_A0114 family putative DNA-binding protein [Geoalkalibacter halelectricus]|uniref:HTH marR-type domain-containing protein n=1 Tax=Geoalkalibacter halelectricus TaxID=2847045 RepID=A0ABY5ZPN9_9BACT|nr:hypothetical protein [Geoalkalibacter halelectricus]MDO3380257.1 hypothetical protein [Geoalkalibacter halelectricus]UWZ79669.1 hypothetical protein L9S41_18605 [Geoalkalibacter halelectricus]